MYKELKRELTVPSKNSYVYKLGFRHAILWYRRSHELEQDLAKKFGNPAKCYHYTTFTGKPKLKSCFSNVENNRWFYGPQRWNDRDARHCHWAVFKNEKDRTLALLTL